MNLTKIIFYSKITLGDTMRIGIDIDGVLTDIEKWQLDYGSKFFYENYGKEIIVFDKYETNEIFKVSKEQDDEFWNKYFKDYSINIEARKFASEVIKKLKKERNKIYIITARGNFLSHSAIMSFEENKNIVINWLKENEIEYDELIFCVEDKLDTCLKNNIDIMIEDKVENINRISTKIPVICFHAEYNKNCIGENIIRCYSWYDIYSKLKRIN